MQCLAIVIIAVTVTSLLLSAAGIYSMMSFTVAGRRREIGIRAALGADARRVLAGIFGRASAQLGAGVAAGLAIASALEWLAGGQMMGGKALVLLPSVVVVMCTVGLLAAVGPRPPRPRGPADGGAARGVSAPRNPARVSPPVPSHLAHQSDLLISFLTGDKA